MVTAVCPLTTATAALSAYTWRSWPHRGRLPAGDTARRHPGPAGPADHAGKRRDGSTAFTAGGVADCGGAIRARASLRLTGSLLGRTQTGPNVASRTGGKRAVRSARWTSLLGYICKGADRAQYS